MMKRVGEEPGELPLMRSLHTLKQPKESPALKARSRKSPFVDSPSPITHEPISTILDAFDQDLEAAPEFALSFQPAAEGGHVRSDSRRRKHGPSRTPQRSFAPTNSWNAGMHASYENDSDSRVSWGFGGPEEVHANVDANTAAWHIEDDFQAEDGIFDEIRRGCGSVSQDRTTEWVTSSANEDFGSASFSEHQVGFFPVHHDDSGRFKALQKASKLEQGHKQWMQSDKILSPLILNPDSGVHKSAHSNLVFNLEGPSNADDPDEVHEWIEYPRVPQQGEAPFVKAGSRSRSPLSQGLTHYFQGKHSVGRFEEALPQMSNAVNNNKQKYPEDFRAVPSEPEFFGYEVDAMERARRKESREGLQKSIHFKQSKGLAVGKDDWIRASSTGTGRRPSMMTGHHLPEQAVLSNHSTGAKAEPLHLLTELEDYNGGERDAVNSIDGNRRSLPMRESNRELDLVACHNAAPDMSNPGRLMERACAESLQLSVRHDCTELAICDLKPRSLSQKYRPKAFEEVVGQHIVAQALTSAIQKGRIAPVYLFQGSRGTGKTSAARIFAAALLCVSSEGQRPCGACRDCVNITAGKCSEVREVDAASNNGIERVKALLEGNISTPPLARYKVFIIDECHVLTTETWNCLLKILEEPPMNVVFILITTESDQLPRTVVSRCQRFPFPKIKETEIVKRLQKLASLEELVVDAETLHLIASRSEGSLRDAETILDQVSLLGQQINSSNVYQLVGSVSDERLLYLLNSALVADTISTARRARDLIDSGVEPLSLMSRLAALITDILAGTFKFSDKQRKGFFRRESLSMAKLERLRIAMKTLSEAEKQLRTSNDRTTWLIAALLQLGPDRSLMLPTSYVSSVSQSPIALDEDEVVDFEHRSSGRQTWSDGDRDATAAPNLNSISVPDDAIYERAQYWTKESAPEGAPKARGLSSPHPGQASSKSLRGTENLAFLTELPDEGFDSSIEQTLNPSKLNGIWCKVLERCQSKPLRQLLHASVRLVSISISEVDAVVHLEIFNPDDNASCGRSQKRIANLFETVLGFPVEVKMTLASLPAEAESPKTPEDGLCAVSGSNIHNCLQQADVKGCEIDDRWYNVMKIPKASKAMEGYPGTSHVTNFKNNRHLDFPTVECRHMPFPDGERHLTAHEINGDTASGELEGTQVYSSSKPRVKAAKLSSGEQQTRQHASRKDVCGERKCCDNDVKGDLFAEERELNESELHSLDFNEDNASPGKNWRARHSMYESPVAMELQAFDARHSDADLQRRKGIHLNMVQRISMRNRIRSLPSSDPNSPDRVDANVCSPKHKDVQDALEALELARDAGDSTTKGQKRGKLKGGFARFLQGKLSK